VNIEPQLSPIEGPPSVAEADQADPGQGRLEGVGTGRPILSRERVAQLKAMQSKPDERLTVEEPEPN
jgi:hypothetical protein